jgi:FAD binding domain
MKLSFACELVFLSLTLCFSNFPVRALLPSADTPEGCKRLAGDESWPAPDIWIKEIPGVVPRGTSKNQQKHPDYRITAKNVEDVQRAIRFASKYNVRVSIINSGHDYMGRNDSPTGLWIDVSWLQGVRVTPTFTPTIEGMPAPLSKTNVIPPQKIPAAVTFGVGINTASLNKAIKASKLFTLGAAHGKCKQIRWMLNLLIKDYELGSVSVAGGWGQLGGHSPLSNQYGLGVDQFLEFKVVTSDGQYRVANKVSNPDLFWALRGGGGGTFGVVTEATIKAYPHEPITAYSWWMNTTNSGFGALLGSFLGLPGSPADGLSNAYEVLGKALPDLGDKATSAYIVPGLGSLRGVGITVGENATSGYANGIWRPVLDKMKSVGGMQEPQIKLFHFDNYQEFFDYTYENGMLTGCYNVQTVSGKVRRHGPKEIVGTGCERKNLVTRENGQTLRTPAKVEKRHGLAFTDVDSHTDSLNQLAKRHGPGEGGLQSMSMNKSAAEPMTPGIVNMDSVLLGRRHFQSPQFGQLLKKNPVNFGLLLVGGNKAHRPDDDVSVNPAWRTASVHMLGIKQWPMPSLKPWQDLASDSGSYGNEVSVHARLEQSLWLRKSRPVIKRRTGRKCSGVPIMKSSPK